MKNYKTKLQWHVIKIKIILFNINISLVMCYSSNIAHIYTVSVWNYNSFKYEKKFLNITILFIEYHYTNINFINFMISLLHFVYYQGFINIYIYIYRSLFLCSNNFSLFVEFVFSFCKTYFLHNMTSFFFSENFFIIISCKTFLSLFVRLFYSAVRICWVHDCWRYIVQI